MVGRQLNTCVHKQVKVFYIRKALFLSGNRYCSVTSIDNSLCIQTLNRAVTLHLVGDIKAQTGKTISAKWQANVTRHILQGAVFGTCVLSGFILQRNTFSVFFQTEVEYTGYRIRAVLCRCAVAQYFNLLQGNCWDHLNIGEVSA